MKTYEEIVKYYQENQGKDIFGFMADVLLPYLPFEYAKPFLKDEANPENWPVLPLNVSSIIKEMQEYMSFAWEKAQDHRGLSAGRSVEKIRNWLWLLDDEKTLAFAQDSRNYPQYGIPILKKVSEVYGFPVPEGSDIENMAQGKPCYPGCDGCGH